ncbi:NPH-I transcription termination factor [Carp edema virus]|nr:NPH-I transcription termination factor [Carp edema virus]
MKDKFLKDYQLFAAQCFLGLDEMKSILLFQETGFGKTLTTVYMINKLKTQYTHWSVIILAKASLTDNPWATTLVQYCDKLDNFSILAYDDPFFANKFFTHLKTIGEKHRIFLVIDEVHNFISRCLSTEDKPQRKLKRVYNEIVRLIHDSNNKLIVLSATPLVNSVEEFKLLIDFIRPGVLNNTQIFKNEKLLYKEELKEGLAGICSCKRNQDYGIFDNIPYIDGFASRNVNIQYIQMSPVQESIYLLAEKHEHKNKTAGFKSLRRAASAFTYKEMMAKGDKSDHDHDIFVKESFNSFKMEFDVLDPKRSFTQEAIESFKQYGNPDHLKNANDIMIYNSLFEYSSKYATVCCMILKSPGKCLIFEPFVKLEGITILSEYLKLFKINFIEYSSRTKQIRNKLLDQFNLENNHNGEKLKVCLFSPSGNEGVSYLCINDIFILDLTWNEANLKQIMGRAIRLNSHQALPEERRYVNVNILINKKTHGISVDEELFNIIKVKSKQINQLFDLLYQCSIENIYKKYQPTDLPVNENLLKNFVTKEIKFEEKNVQKQFVKVVTVHYAFDLKLNPIFVGYIDAENKLYSEDGLLVTQVTENMTIKIKDKKLIYVVN